MEEGSDRVRCRIFFKVEEEGGELKEIVLIKKDNG